MSKQFERMALRFIRLAIIRWSWLPGYGHFRTVYGHREEKLLGDAEALLRELAEPGGVVKEA